MRLALLGLALLVSCVIVQSIGMLALIHWLARVHSILESPSTPRRVALLLRLFLAIVLLHLIQSASGPAFSGPRRCCRTWRPRFTSPS
jgi:hypothetical protein